MGNPSTKTICGVDLDKLELATSDFEYLRNTVEVILKALDKFGYENI